MIEDQQQTNPQLSALLRLKRFEQPPPGYYEKLLQDIHRRQRAELIRRPLWAIAVERVQTFFSVYSPSQLSYAGATAAVVLTGVTLMGVMSGGRGGVTSPRAMAQASKDTARPVDLRADFGSSSNLLSLQHGQGGGLTALPQIEQTPLANVRLLPANAVSRQNVVRSPRYVIDTRPASYEATTVSFNF